MLFLELLPCACHYFGTMRTLVNRSRGQVNPFNSSVFKVLTVGLPWQLSLLLLVWGVQVRLLVGETKIPHAMQPKKLKHYCNKFFKDF